MRPLVAVAHAAFDATRKRGLERILDTLPGVDVHVSRSEKREPAFVWARRLWDWASVRRYETDRVILLNDDVEVCPQLVEAVEAMPTTGLISLHCSLPASKSLAEAGIPWCRSYWLTGPGYVTEPWQAEQMSHWWASQPEAWARSVNEDNVAIHWSYRRGRPIWQAIPALVKHDTAFPSMLGYDHHALRTTLVPWTEYPDAPVTSQRYWEARTDEAPFIENPWARCTRHLEPVERSLRAGMIPTLCWFCQAHPAEVVAPATFAQICRRCIASALPMLARPTRARKRAS